MEIFTVALIFALIATAFVITQTIVILFLLKWNNELRQEVELNKPPF